MKQSIKIVFFLFLILAGFGNLSAQMRRADLKYDNYQYSEAIPFYKEVLALDSLNIAAWIKLADCYRLTNHTKEAEKCYAYVVKSDSSPAVCKLYYAQMLLTNEKFVQARQWFVEYSIDEPADKRGTDFVDAIRTRDKMTTDSVRFIIKKLDLNSGDADFGAVPYKNGIVFSSSRLNKKTKTKRDLWTGNRYMSLYFAKGSGSHFDAPELFIPQIQVKFNNGPICFNSAGSEMYFTRNSAEENLSNIDYKVDKLKIFSMVVENGKSDPKEFQYNNPEYSCAHPVLNKDGTKLYFSSDMPGTRGGMDLWVCSKVTEGWSKPENLGPEINTKGNEIFPTLDDNDNIYFSSNGLPGLGGLDIFTTKFLHGRYVEPHNAGAPFNSSDDDFSLYINPKTRAGYFSSNRTRQEYNDDIYAFNSNEIILKGNILDKLSSSPISMADISIIEEGAETELLNSDDQGKFSAFLVPHKIYHIIAKNKNYKTDTVSFKMDTVRAANDSLSLNITLENLFERNNVFVMSNILYSYNKFKIRPDAAVELDKLVKLMNEKPNLKIELSSHTDCRASDEYNIKLSEKRAAAAVDYLVKKGIDKNRLVSKGYGETKPLHVCDCENNKGSNCTEKEYQVNRRTEVKILEN